MNENEKAKLVHENSRRESSEGLDRTVLHRLLVRIQPWGRFFTSSHLGKVDFSQRPPPTALHEWWPSVQDPLGEALAGLACQAE